MERIRYLFQRELEVKPKVQADYFSKIHRFQDEFCSRLWEFRLNCVDRIYKMAVVFNASDTTAFTAVRMFDRCMAASATNNIGYCVMSMLAVACFDIAHKCIDTEKPLYLPVLMHYAQHEKNEFCITEFNFLSTLRATELGVMAGTQSEPVLPTPQEYVRESVPEWTPQRAEMRSAALLCSAFAYTTSSLQYTAMEMAVAATLLSKKPEAVFGRAMNAMIAGTQPERIQAIQLEMLTTVDRLFTQVHDTGLSRLFADCKYVWGMGLKM